MYENMRKAKAQKRQDANAPSYPAILPQKRRVITIVDYDFGRRETKIIMEKNRDRNDSFVVTVNGEKWSQPRSWSFITEKLRTAYPRVRAL